MKKPLLFLLALSVLTLYGCESASKTKIIEIGCAGPLTGDQAQLGIDTCQGVSLAIDEANQKGLVPGFTLRMLSLDDQHTPAQAVNVAKKFASNLHVLSVIGHFNSSCTQPASAVYEEAGLVNITPASTNPALSKQGFKCFFRVASTDDVQGPAAARFAAKKLKVKSVYVLDDKTTYGKGLADEFEKEAKAQGIKVLGHQGITQGEKDFSPVLTKIKPLAPQMIFFGGIYTEGALLLRQARSLNLPAIFMGGDGIAAQTLIDLATAPVAEGTYATMIGGDIRTVAGSEKFIQAYEAKFGALGQWSVYGYDAANIAIAAIAKAPAKDRPSVLAAMREIPEFEGVTGKAVFDAKGDNQNQFIGVFKVENGTLGYVGVAE